MAAEKNVNHEVKERKIDASARASESDGESEYSMPDEVCCSPEFPQGCISAH